jgi:hypothetical protein
VRASFAGVELGRVELGAAAGEAAWPVAHLLRRGLNTLVLTAEGGGEGAAVELLEAAAR